METQRTENPRLTPQNLVRENIQETKKENNEIETPLKNVKPKDWYTKPMYPTQNQSTQQTETESVYDPKEIQTKSESLAIRRPQPEVKCQMEIDKTIEKARIEGKAANTLLGFRHRLRQLSRICDLNNP